MIKENKASKYLLYAIGEIVLVVIGILIALSINNWNQKKKRVAKEIEILKAFQAQLRNDVKELDKSIAFYRVGKESMNTILYHLEEDLQYNDSLKLEFFNTTRTWGTSDLNNNVFESLKSIGVDLISNQDLRNKIVNLYDDDDVWIKKNESDYIEIVFDASKTIYNTRFKDFWNGDYKDPNLIGEMIPLDFEKLKNDQEYLYFLRSLKNELGWLIENPIETTKINIIDLFKMIENEIQHLEN